MGPLDIWNRLRLKRLRNQELQEFLILRHHFASFMIKKGHPIQAGTILDHESPKISSTNWRKCHEISIPPAFTVDGMKVLHTSLARTQWEDVEESESTATYGCHEAPIGDRQDYSKVSLNIGDFLLRGPPPFKAFKPEWVSRSDLFKQGLKLRVLHFIPALLAAVRGLPDPPPASYRTMPPDRRRFPSLAPSNDTTSGTVYLGDASGHPHLD